MVSLGFEMLTNKIFVYTDLNFVYNSIDLKKYFNVHFIVIYIVFFMVSQTTDQVIVNPVIKFVLVAKVFYH